MRFLPLLWSNLTRRKVRTALTILSIMIAFVLFGFLSAIAQALAQGVDVAGADRLVVRHAVSIIQLLPESYERRMEALEGVDAAMHFTWFGGIYQDPRNFFAQMPVEPEELLDMYPEYLLPADQREAWLATRTGAIAGRQLADRFGWSIGDRIPIQATAWTKKDGGRTWDFDLVGIYDGAEKGTDVTQFYFRHDYFDEGRGLGRGLVGWYAVRVADPARAAEVAQAIDAEFANSPAETKTETEGAFVQAFANQVGNIAAITAAVLGAVFFTILLVAGNTMAQAVRERREELGVLKAIGFTDGRILGLLIGESCLVASLGGLAGLASAWVAIRLMGDPTGGALPIFYLPTDDLLIGVGLVLLLGVVTGVVPAVQGMRLRMADALKRI